MRQLSVGVKIRHKTIWKNYSRIFTFMEQVKNTKMKPAKVQEWKPET